MKYLNSDGLRTVLSKIKGKFATKQELQDVKKKVGGGHEEIIVRITAPTNNKDQRNFKLVKTGRRVDVYQIHYGYPYKTSLPLKYQADEITFIGLALQNNDKAFINGDSYTEGLYVDNNLHLSNKALYANSLRIRVLDDISFTIDKVYIGSYITKE